MLKNITPKELIEQAHSDYISGVAKDIEKRQAAGEKIILKLQYTKSAVYLNVYEYDKTSWRHLLTDKYELIRL